VDDRIADGDVIVQERERVAAEVDEIFLDLDLGQ